PLATFEPGLSRADLNDRAIQALRLVGLSADFAARYPHELSGGQAQRIGIARAIIGKPKLIVCDEPVSALDVSIQAQVVNLLMDLKDQLGLALIFISHNLAIVRHISHDIMVMCLGRTVESAPRDAFYAHPLHPYAQALKSAVPEPDPKIERTRRNQSLPGDLPSVLDPPPGCVFATRCPRTTDLCRTTRPALRDFGHRHAACHHIEGYPQKADP
ncbi:MAG: oligopeptide/dipeptide ABC transporter ATP-binding protein, partial [Paracoccaceae bacterium]